MGKPLTKNSARSIAVAVGFYEMESCREPTTGKDGSMAALVEAASEVSGVFWTFSLGAHWHEAGSVPVFQMGKLRQKRSPTLPRKE